MGEKEDLKKIERIISRVRESALKIEGVDRLILYGSCVRGEAKEDSDIDILIVVDDSINPREVEEKLDDLLFEILLEEKKLVSLVVVKKSVFENSRLPLFLNVREEGVPV